MAENAWYPMPPKKRRGKAPTIKCECCHEVKPRDGNRPCLECKAAKCKFNCGVWKPGDECPKRKRARKSKSGVAIRKTLNRFG